MLAVDGIQRRGVEPIALSQPRRSMPPARPNLAAMQIVDGIRLPQAALRPAVAMAEPTETPATAWPSEAPQAPGRNYVPAITAALAVPLSLAIGWTVTHRHFSLPLAQVQTLKAVTATQAAADQAQSTQAAAQAQSQAIQSTLNSFAAKYPGQFGVYVKDLKTGAVASTGASRVVESASLYKLFVAQTILKMVDTGSLSLGQTTSEGHNVQDCLNLMITVSSNECGHALGDIIGWGKQDATLRTFGYKDTSLGAGDSEPSTTAADVSMFFDRLYSGTLLSPSSSGLLLEFLKNQKVNDRLPTGLPAGTMIAHKTGDLDGFVHDAGIVYGPKTDYLVVAVSGPWSAPGTAPQAFTDLSQQLWAQLQQ